MSADGSLVTPPKAEPPKGFNLSAWAIAHGNFAAFLIVLLLAAGGYAFATLGQREDPDFTFRTMVVNVLWPGASVEEMQEQVVDKIERKLQETPGLEFLRSYTRAGSANIFVNLRGNVRGQAVADAFYQVRKKVGDIRHTLPEGVLGPFFNDEFGDTYMSLYALTGQGYSYPELKTFAKNARDILLRVPGVAKVDLLGTQEERIFIEISSVALAERGLTALDIQAALAGQNAMDPAGRIETTERSVRIDVEGGLRTVDDVRELRLRAGQQVFRLGDIAEVKRALEDPARCQDPLPGPRGGAARRHHGARQQRHRGRRRGGARAQGHRAGPAGRRTARQDLRSGTGGQQVRARVPALAGGGGRHRARGLVHRARLARRALWSR